MKYSLKTKATALFLILVIIGLILFYYCHDLPSLTKLEKQQSQRVIHINYDNSLRMINSSNITQEAIDYSQIPKHLINAVIITEDRRFFSHYGIDIYGIIRAYLANYKAGKIVQGGSTITQQLAKMLFLKPQKTFKRKIQEAILAVQLEQYYNKEQILTFYLNRAYFGSGNYGVLKASQKYFKKNISEITKEESAVLAGILKAPSKISPINNLKLSQQRTDLILKIIAKNNKKNSSKSDQDYEIKKYGKFYFSDFIIENYQKFLPGNNEFQAQEITINTTLNQQYQEKLENILNNFYKKNFKKISQKQIAVIIADNSGAIKAMIGGNNYRKDEFNHGTDNSKRIGSMIDNFIYLHNLENQNPKNQNLKNQNLNSINSKKYLSLIKKKNILNENNPNSNLNWRKNFDKTLNIFIKSDSIIINKNQKDLTNIKISLIDLISFFATIKNNGILTKPYAINNIKDKNGNILYKNNDFNKTKLLKTSSILIFKKTWQDQMIKNNLKSENNKFQEYNQEDFLNKIYNINDESNWIIGFDDDKIIGIWLESDHKKNKKTTLKNNYLMELFADIFNNIKD